MVASMLKRKTTRRGQNREINRHLRGIAARANNDNPMGKAAARRRKQMLKGQMKPANGVVRFTEEDEVATRKALADYFLGGDSV